MELLNKKPGRGWSRIMNIMKQARSFELHTYRAGDMLQWWLKLPQPDLCPFNGEFRKEHREEPFGECFQQGAVLRRSDCAHSICDMRIVDRTVDVIRSRSWFGLTGQFKIHR